MTPEQTLQVLEFLAGAYPEHEITQRVAATFSLALANAEAKSVRVAAMAYVRSEQRFFPRPGNLLVGETDLDAPTPEEAWGEVYAAGETHTWSHPRIERAIVAVLGPWRRFYRDALNSEMVAHRARFIDAYRGMESRDRDRLHYSEAKSLIESFPTLRAAEDTGLLTKGASGDEEVSR